MIQFVVASVSIRGSALPLARLNFVTRITPKRKDIVFGGDYLSDALRMTKDDAQMVINRMPFGVFMYPVNV